jgi:hypothetical protein
MEPEGTPVRRRSHWGDETESDNFVPVPPDLRREIEAWIASHPEPQNPRAFLFPNARGSAYGVGNYLKRHLKPLGEEVGLHDLTHQLFRRTSSVQMQNHATVKDMQRHLRHSDPQTTLKHYAKVIPASLRSAVAALDAEMTGTATDTSSRRMACASRCFSSRTYARLQRPKLAEIIPQAPPASSALRAAFDRLNSAIEACCKDQRLAAYLTHSNYNSQGKDSSGIAVDGFLAVVLGEARAIRGNLYVLADALRGIGAPVTALPINPRPPKPTLPWATSLVSLRGLTP